MELKTKEELINHVDLTELFTFSSYCRSEKAVTYTSVRPCIEHSYYVEISYIFGDDDDFILDFEILEYLIHKDITDINLQSVRLHEIVNIYTNE